MLSSLLYELGYADWQDWITVRMHLVRKVIIFIHKENAERLLFLHKG